jgi:hypothetical protein
MNEKRLPGIRFEAITMPVAPTAAKFKGQTIPAIRFAVTDRRGVPAGPHLAPAHRRDPPAASARLRLERRPSTASPARTR